MLKERTVRRESELIVLKWREQSITTTSATEWKLKRFIGRENARLELLQRLPALHQKLESINPSPRPYFASAIIPFSHFRCAAAAFSSCYFLFSRVQSERERNHHHHHHVARLDLISL